MYAHAQWQTKLPYQYQLHIKIYITSFHAPTTPLDGKRTNAASPTAKKSVYNTSAHCLFCLDIRGLEAGAFLPPGINYNTKPSRAQQRSKLLITCTAGGPALAIAIRSLRAPTICNIAEIVICSQQQQCLRPPGRQDERERERRERRKQRDREREQQRATADQTRQRDVPSGQDRRRRLQRRRERRQRNRDNSSNDHCEQPRDEEKRREMRDRQQKQHTMSETDDSIRRMMRTGMRRCRKNI